MQNSAPIARRSARRRSFNVTFRFAPAVAYALVVLARSEDRTRTQIVSRAIKHYLESYYPDTRRLVNLFRTISVNLKMWAVGVRSEALWGDKGVRYDSSSKLNEAFQETLKLALYAGKGLKVEMTLHIYLLTSYLAQAKALMLRDGERTAILEIALNAEKETESLTTKAAAEEGQADDEARTQPPEERESQSSEGFQASSHD